MSHVLWDFLKFNIKFQSPKTTCSISSATRLTKPDCRALSGSVAPSFLGERSTSAPEGARARVRVLRVWGSPTAVGAARGGWSPIREELECAWRAAWTDPVSMLARQICLPETVCVYIRGFAIVYNDLEFLIAFMCFDFCNVLMII